MEKEYTEQTMEIIKALAIGLSDGEAAENERMSVEEIKQFRMDYAEDIADRIDEFKRVETMYEEEE